MEAVLKHLAPEDLIPTPDNPRVILDDGPEMVELAASVREQGVLIPVLARPHPTEEGMYDLRYGHRRLRAAILAGCETLPVLVADMTDEEAFEQTFTENFAREDLSPVEEGRAVTILLERSGDDVAAVAARLGHTEKWVRLRARLADLIVPWQNVVSDPEWEPGAWFGVGHLVLVARFPEDVQLGILEDVAGWGAEVVSVKDFERWLNDEWVRLLTKAPWKLDDAEVLDGAPACSACIKRSSLQGQLFDDDLASDDRCLDPACWAEKEGAWLVQRHAAAASRHGTVLIAADYYPNSVELQACKDRFGAEPIEGWKYEKCKKSTPGAQPAFVACGPGAGKTIWIKPRKEAAASQARTNADGARAPTPLAQRRERLATRRRKRVLEFLQAALDRAKPPELEGDSQLPDAFLLIRLAATFGTHRRRQRASDGEWKELATLTKKPIADQVAALWQTVRKVLHRRLEWFTPGETAYADAEAMCKALGWQFKKFVADAEAAIPEPKAWANLNADGTPKKAKPKSKMKGKKKGA